MVIFHSYVSLPEGIFSCERTYRSYRTYPPDLLDPVPGVHVFRESLLGRGGAGSAPH